MLLLWPLLAISQQFWLLTTEFWDGPKTRITLADDSVLYVSTTTGVLKSTDDGNHFEKVLSASSVHTVFASSSGTVFAGGTGKIYFSLKITSTTGLTVSPNDSLYLSFYGIAYNHLVQLNICKSIDDITLESSWRALHVDQSVSWWTDRPLNNIHFLQKGDWYSSYTQLAHIGATYFSETGGNFWNRIDYGLGLSEDGWRNPQQFVEKSSGRIFMIQNLDERIYTTDKSLVTDVKPPLQNSGSIHVFPNPVKAGEKLTVQISTAGNSVEISIYDLAGRKLLENSGSNRLNELTVPEKPGIYIVAAKYQDAVKTEKILVQ